MSAARCGFLKKTGRLIHSDAVSRAGAGYTVKKEDSPVLYRAVN